MSATDRESPAEWQAVERVQTFFEPQLAELGLSVEQIENQTPGECRNALKNVNDAIENPDSLGTFQVRFEAKKNNRLIPSRIPEGPVSVNPLPVLLERKSKILRRIGSVAQQDLTDLETIAATVEDQTVRESLLTQVDGMTAQAQAWIVEAEQTEMERKRQIRLIDVEAMERTSAMRRAWFERESVASIVGAVLLISLGAAVITSMFTHTAASQIVTSSFLLILGYFFGQAGSNKRRRGRAGTKRSKNM